MISSPLDLKTRTFLPSANNLMPTRSALPNIAIFNAVSGKADRVGIKLLADGKKVRVFKSSGDEIKSA